MEKLKEGDFCECKNIEDFSCLMSMQLSGYVAYPYNEKDNSNIVVWNGLYLDVYIRQKSCLKKPKTRLTFEEFKQRAINTFGNGTKN